MLERPILKGIHVQAGKFEDCPMNTKMLNKISFLISAYKFVIIVKFRTNNLSFSPTLKIFFCAITVYRVQKIASMRVVTTMVI